MREILILFDLLNINLQRNSLARWIDKRLNNLVLLRSNDMKNYYNKSLKKL